MKPFQPFTINPLNWAYHGGEHGFREQMSVLRVVGDTEDNMIKLVRSFLTVGTTGMSGFDAGQPGEDTAKGWEVLDALIENESVRGTFHTHPPGIHSFSSKDWQAIEGLAKANGGMPIFHGVQAIDAQNAHFVCARMLAGQVHVYDLGWHESDLNDPVIILPGPPRVRVNGSVLFFTSSYE